MLSLLLGATLGLAQTQTDPNFHTWLLYNGDHPIREGGKWGLHLEGQWRRNDFVTKWQQLLLRPGVNYRVNQHVELGAGYAFINSYRYGQFPARFVLPEQRSWQDVRIRHAAGKVRFLHRARLEQRWLGQKSTPDRLDRWAYENRFRYLLKATIPFKDPKWGITLWNEMWLPFAPETHPAVFDQNRTTAALVRKFGSHWRVEAGYMYQPFWQRNGRVREDNHTLTIALFSEAPFLSRKK
jgi:hypothetical protein